MIKTDLAKNPGESSFTNLWQHRVSVPHESYAAVYIPGMVLIST
jgi:hypothetical protein